MRFLDVSRLGVCLSACFLLAGCLSEGPQRAREGVLQTNLSTMRTVISSYQEERGTLPQALEDLVDEGYIRAVPADPFVGNAESWTLVYEDSAAGTQLIRDVRSSSQEVGLNGIPYNLW